MSHQDLICRWKIRGLWALVGVLILHGSAALGTPADPCMEDGQCKELVDSARLLSKSEKFEAALAVYQAAYQRQPVPWLLVNVGRMQQKLGRKEQASASFRRYLNDPAAAQDDLTRMRATEFLKQLGPESGGTTKLPNKTSEKISAGAQPKLAAKKMESAASRPELSKLDDAAIVGPPMVNEKLRIAETYLREKNWREALRSASNPSLMDAAPESSTRIIGIAACHLRDLTRAQASYGKLNAAGSTAGRNLVAQACRENEVMLMEDSLLSAEKLLDSGDYRAALQMVEGKALPSVLPLRAWRVVGLSACHLKDRVRATQAFDALDKRGRYEIEEACGNAGIFLERRPLVSPQAAEQALLQAESYYRQRRLAQAMVAAREAVDGHRLEGWTIIGMASCMIGDLTRVDEAYQHVPQDGQRQIKATCSAQQINLSASGRFVRGGSSQ